MHSARAESPSTAVAGAVSLALATGAALALTAANLLHVNLIPADELVSLGFILGWALIAGAVTVAVAVVVQLVRPAAPRRASRVEILLIAATALVIAGTIAAYPLFGSGGGSA